MCPSLSREAGGHLPLYRFSRGQVNHILGALHCLEKRLNNHHTIRFLLALVSRRTLVCVALTNNPPPPFCFTPVPRNLETGMPFKDHGEQFMKGGGCRWDWSIFLLPFCCVQACGQHALK